MRSKIKAVQTVADDYLDLVKRFPLRPIRTEAQYEQAARVLAGLLARADNPGLSSGESDYADALGEFLGSYDAKHYPILKVKTPLERLRLLMKLTGMNVTQLGELLGGGSGHASLIYNGKRELSKANIRKLADRFKVSPAAFL
jgi:HTH-type transcriptional regulator/antitoxin HigA